MVKSIVMKTIAVFFLAVTTVSAIKVELLGTYNSFRNIDMKSKKDDVLTFQYVSGEGKYLSDLWVSGDDIEEATRYNPTVTNSYYLFTRDNPILSQVILYNDQEGLIATNYFHHRKTIILLHGFQDNSTSTLSTLLVPAFLHAEDVNVIVVDWSQGAGSGSYAAAVINTPPTGVAVANFITWLSVTSGSDLSNFHIVGHNLGAHQAGIVGRELMGQVNYITGLDPAFNGWLTHDDRFKSTDGAYTEVIHTNAGFMGFPTPLGDVDFYPNGGLNMPGCITQQCDSYRSIHYMAESLKAGGFTGTRCATLGAAKQGHCIIPESLNMGGAETKIGRSGIFYLRTNADAPFSRG